ncbi:MAG: NAD(P)/FAD-dependent oxidoreductase [Armatimonadota bacterium]
MGSLDFLIVGAGLAGLAAARDLADHGATVRVLDKGRVPGGRAATRRIEGQPVDHGAQFCTSRSDRMQTLLSTHEALGKARVWSHGFPTWSEGAVVPRTDGHPRWCYPEGMRTLAGLIAEGLDVRCQSRAVVVSKEDKTWMVTTEDGTVHRAPRLILNMPTTQLVALAGRTMKPEAVLLIASVRMEPAWALFGPVREDFGDGWPAIECTDDPCLAWVARDHTKRGPGAFPMAVVHARGDWSAEHLEDPEDQVRTALETAARRLGVHFLPGAMLHRWRYSKPGPPLDEPYLRCMENDIATIGDWCTGGRVEGALQSGWALAASWT